MNYWIVAPVLLAVFILVFLLLRRNRKDKKDFARTLNERSMNPGKDSNKEKI
ncbi:hypothetical protein ACFOET_16725 [Parapedobacter deserti]|uniref:LPXTG-motif cell wall anchor domain-containing protein n=1 Tax=Parapedobacter deserti TaxID=1912957 RepID=A0ABV7JMS6_9SPHI